MLNSFWGKYYAFKRPLTTQKRNVTVVFIIFVGKFAQHTNMTKVEMITDPQVYFDYLTSDEINVLEARFVSDEMIEIHYENNENFIAPNAKTNVVITAFTTAYARLKLYGVLDMLQERVLYYDTDSIIFVSKTNDP